MKPLRPQRYLLTLGLCALVPLAMLVISPGIGTESNTIGLLDAWRAFFAGDTTATAYLFGFELRLPRTLLALQAGFTLSLCGAVFQILFRNPLATPYTLGVVNGGSLGALVAVKFGAALSALPIVAAITSTTGISLISIASFAGSMLVIGLILLITRGARRMGRAELLLAGVTMGLFCSALMMLLTYLSNVRQTFNIIRWMMGSLDTVAGEQTVPSLVLLLPSWGILLWQGRALNQYIAGEDIAAARGVSVRRLQTTCLVFGSLATSAVIAVCGPIGFVGLVVPQLAAILLGRDCRILLPASALLGAAFLAGCDWVSQLALGWWSAATGMTISSVSLPIGVVTALIGVPIFLALLYRNASGNPQP